MIFLEISICSIAEISTETEHRYEMASVGNSCDMKTSKKKTINIIMKMYFQQVKYSANKKQKIRNPFGSLSLNIAFFCVLIFVRWLDLNTHCTCIIGWLDHLNTCTKCTRFVGNFKLAVNVDLFFCCVCECVFFLLLHFVNGFHLIVCLCDGKHTISICTLQTN